MPYKNPKPTVDIIVDQNASVLLIKRRNPPFGWALPGGFVDEGESVEEAAIREAKEETNVDITLKHLLYVYSNPNRDSRQHNISIVFIADAFGEVIPGDDATQAQFFPLNQLPILAFDHQEIISDYIHWKESGLNPDPSEKLPT